MKHLFHHATDMDAPFLMVCSGLERPDGRSIVLGRVALVTETVPAVCEACVPIQATHLVATNL